MLGLTTLRSMKQGTDSAIATARLRARGIRVGRNLRMLGPSRIQVWQGGQFKIGDNVTIGEGARIRVFNQGVLLIEDGVRINDYCCIECSGNMTIQRDTNLVDGVIVYCEGEVNIGAHVLIAAYTLIADVDHNIDRLDVPIKHQGNTQPSAVTIGDGVWLGNKVTVTKGVTIGEGAVIGANAVVTKDVPPYAIAVGIPAKVIRYRNERAESRPLEMIK